MFLVLKKSDLKNFRKVYFKMMHIIWFHFHKLINIENDREDNIGC